MRYTAAAWPLGALTVTRNVPSALGLKRLTSTTLWQDTRRTRRIGETGVVSGRLTRPAIVTLPLFEVSELTGGRPRPASAPCPLVEGGERTVTRRCSLSGSDSSLPISAR